ncbi:hypothetical protein BHECKSOX_1981 [Bathymodiolus heckerae thiotrophic gill symbiont]|nr:hypothetical protein BHECKSOX_1981 [Bathymodiolus heckerae thiotrophic gill symbiont]
MQGIYNPLVSNTLFLEYEDVSKREKILELCPITNNEIRKLLNAFYKTCRWVPIYFLWRPNIKDEDDNFLIELALAGNAPCMSQGVSMRQVKESEFNTATSDTLTC